jgi:hypothetical protein
MNAETLKALDAIEQTTQKERDRAQGFEICRMLVLCMLGSRPILRAHDVLEIGNPFAGLKNGHPAEKEKT